MSTVWGIDPSTLSYAIAIATDGRIILADTITAPKNPDSFARICWLHGALHARLHTADVLGHAPDLVAVEAPGSMVNVFTQGLMRDTALAARLAAYRVAVRTVAIHNQTWKAFLSPGVKITDRGKRPVQKARARAALLARCPELATDLTQDLVDACGIALYAEAALREDRLTAPARRATTGRRKKIP